MDEKIYSAEEVADLVHCDVQTLRNQAKSDIAQGRNSQNFNAFQIGSKVVFPKKWIDKKLGVGPAFELGEKIAEWLIAHGWAVEVEDGIHQC